VKGDILHGSDGAEALGDSFNNNRAFHTGVEANWQQAS
jgi:hypothetical protein